jgi:hypothetical protein
MQKWFDMPVENLLVILIAVVALGFVVVWLLGSRGGGISNKIVIRGKNNKVINTQIDKSVKQTQIDTHIHVQAPASAPPPPKSSDDGAAFAIYAVFSFITAFLYLRLFEPVAFASMLLCAFAFGAALALLALSTANMLGDRLAVSLRATLLLVMSVVAGWFLYDAQQMIDPRLVQAARSVPLNADGFVALVKFAWRNSLWTTALASTLICGSCMLFAVRALNVARRIGLAGRIALLDEATYQRYVVMPTWWSMSGFAWILTLMALMRFYWLPYALLVR